MKNPPDNIPLLARMRAAFTNWMKKIEAAQQKKPPGAC